MACLLVSVRSAEEARAALQGGAAVIDVKEPDRGPLGRADFAVWTEVRKAVPSGTPVSVALGELSEWFGADGGTQLLFDPDAGVRAVGDSGPFHGFSFRKMGLAGAGASWEESWARLRKLWGAGPSWVAVIYADWQEAGAPPPDRVLDAALSAEDCAGVLIDTFDKSRPARVDDRWRIWLARARNAGLLTALAGGLDIDTILGLAPHDLHPDIVAVRGAACRGGDRHAPIDPERVARLAKAVACV